LADLGILFTEDNQATLEEGKQGEPQAADDVVKFNQQEFDIQSDQLLSPEEQEELKR